MSNLFARQNAIPADARHHEGIGFMTERVLKAQNQDDICRNITAV